MKTLHLSIISAICFSIVIGTLVLSNTINIAGVLHIQNTPNIQKPHGTPTLPGLTVLLNDSCCAPDPGLQYNVKPGQKILFFVDVKSDPAIIPVKLSVSPKLGFSRPIGIDWELSANQVNHTDTTVLLYVNIGNKTLPGTYPMELDSNTVAIPNENFTLGIPFSLVVSSISNDTAFSILPPIHPPRCEYYPNNTICHGLNMWVDNKLRDYDESQVYDYLNRAVEMDNVTFLYTGYSTPEKDNLNCDTEFPRAINVTFGIHAPIIVFDGYYKVNETRHFFVRFADGATNSTILCWSQFTKPKIIEMCDDLCMPPFYNGMKITWLDKNKTAGILQHQYQTSDYYNAYIAEVRK